ncbi:MAG: peptidoglycan recognition family protein [Chthoniobacterales bacterium]
MPRTLFLIFIGGFFAATMALRADLTDQQKKTLFLQTKKPSASTPASPSPASHKKIAHSATSSKKKTGATHKTHHTTTKHHNSPSTATHSSSGLHHKTIDDRMIHSSSVHSSTVSDQSPGNERTSHHHAPSQENPPNSLATTEHHSTASMTAGHDTIIPIDNFSTHHALTPAAITIEKSGILQDQGLEPVPTTTPEKKHGWGWIFGSSDNTHYHYLSASVRRAIDRAPVRHGRWKYIIVHNSGTHAGNAHSFDIYHRRVRKMVNGLAYHFVIGNGVSSGNGEIEIGHRWTAQLQGGHVASDYLNDISLGICLVGDYNRETVTKEQLGALDELIAYLRHRVGRTQGHESIIKAHKEINPKPTDCPGDRFPYHWLHGRFG